MRVPVVAVVLCLAPALASSQSLGDAARQQERERAARPAPRKVYTDVDLQPPDDPAAGEDSAAPIVADEETPAVERDAAGAPVETTDALRARLDREERERKRRESSWKQRARAVRARLETARREHEVACGPGVLVLTGG
jgi:hypothetical protein